jgi:membrane-associated protease RseP (regulator of RpoE activity)
MHLQYSPQGGLYAITGLEAVNQVPGAQVGDLLHTVNGLQVQPGQDPRQSLQARPLVLVLARPAAAPAAAAVYSTLSATIPAPGPIGMEVSAGGVVTRVVPGSQAELAGVQVGHVVLAVGGTAVEGMAVASMVALLAASPRPLGITLRAAVKTL